MEQIGTQIKGTDVTLAGPKTEGLLRRLAAYHLQREELLAAQGKPQRAREAHRQYKRYLRNARAAAAARAHLERGEQCSGPMCIRQINGEGIRFKHEGKAYCSRNCMQSYFDGIEKGRVRTAALI